MNQSMGDDSATQEKYYSLDHHHDKAMISTSMAEDTKGSQVALSAREPKKDLTVEAFSIPVEIAPSQPRHSVHSMENAKKSP